MNLTNTFSLSLLNKQGYYIQKFPLPANLEDLVRSENWPEIDKLFYQLNSPGSEIFNLMNSIIPITQIEQMLAIRDANNEWEEDGIWHDDGSRKLAYSLSLTLGPESIKGGKLGLRKKNSDDLSLIPTPSFGEAIIFLTGIHGYEHKIHRVESGRRIIMVGWCL